MRQTEIETAVDTFLAAHDKWKAGKDELLTRDYERALQAMANTCLDGDIPASHRKLIAAAGETLREFERIAEYIDETGGHPKPSFWRAVEDLATERQGTVVMPPRPIESVRELRRQGVSDNQIANAIYGHRGEGPFLDRGHVRSDLIQKEIDEPGSVVPAGWVHPVMEEQFALEQREAAKRIAEIADRIRVDPPAPETTEELLRQRVPVEQIALIKKLTIEEVVKEAEELDLPYEFTAGYSGKRDFALSESDQKIADMLATGMNAKQVAEELGITTQKAAAVGRKMNR